MLGRLLKQCLDVLTVNAVRRTWPAVWEVGANWPNQGEIDILEGANDVSPNQATLHTGAGCSMPNNRAMTGYVVSPVLFVWIFILISGLRMVSTATSTPLAMNHAASKPFRRTLTVQHSTPQAADFTPWKEPITS